MSAAPQAHTGAQITPEVIAAAKQRIGCLRPGYGESEGVSTEAHPDTIRRYAIGVGDLNPLWCDPDYAAGTRWKSVVGPPTYAVGGLPPDPPAGMAYPPRGDPLRGLHGFNSAWDVEYYRPFYPGDRGSVLWWIENVEEKQSEFGGVSIKMSYACRIRNQRGDLVKLIRTSTIHTERSGAAKRGKYRDIKRHVYTAEELAAIDAAYEAEEIRGAAPRWWEDVAAGDELTPVVKGPYTVQTFLGYCVGTGSFGAFGDGPLQRGYENRRRVPAFYFRDAYGVPVSAWTCHFDQEIAEAAGNPLPYDVGLMRQAWLTHLVTNWAGDDGFVFRTRIEARRFNYLGDTQWCRGRVTGKRREGDLDLVDLDVWCDNQRGEVTTSGTATVLLPSREHGVVRLPAPPRDVP